jgi:hypothetical protein
MVFLGGLNIYTIGENQWWKIKIILSEERVHEPSTILVLSPAFGPLLMLNFLNWRWFTSVDAFKAAFKVEYVFEG